MDLDWDRLGAALQAARQEMAPKLTQDELAVELGVGRSVIQNIERGQAFKKPTPTIRNFARRVGWTDDSVDRVLAGGDPQLTDGVQESAAQQLPAGPALPTRIEHELKSEGELVDTVVIPLGDGASAVVVVKNPPDATPEQRQRNLDAWLRMQAQLRELDYSGENGTRTSPAANGS
ncbi:helix-turn-helix domain-containing protein [Streptomyces sp. NPDC019443]|uniref:helix-turn-helix domain-containing protein n=1 Tax=Streptomyces sp. NPDC019443 TaxID=3365061 RepID=UPI0037B4F3E5